MSKSAMGVLLLPPPVGLAAKRCDQQLTHINMLLVKNCTGTHATTMDKLNLRLMRLLRFARKG